MKVFITAPFKEGKNKKEIEHLCSILKKSGFEDFCFVRDVENYQKVFDSAKALMQRAQKEIKKCDCLFIDMSNKPTGRVIEAGIAFAEGKKIITVMKRGTVIKDTTRGISDSIMEYEELTDLIEPLSTLFKEWSKNAQ